MSKLQPDNNPKQDSGPPVNHPDYLLTEPAGFSINLPTTEKSIQEDEYRYKRLVRLACHLNSETNLDRLLDMIIVETNNLLNTDRTSLFLIDSDTSELYSKIALGVRKEIRLPLGTGLAGTVAITGETINVQDAQNDSRFYNQIDRDAGYITQNILTMPLRNHSNKIIGVIQAINKRQGSFNESDIEVLDAFASISAISIENASLRRDIERMFDSFVDTMASTIDARSPQTAGHSSRVAFYAQKVALELGMAPEQAYLVYLAGLLHDYGKIGVPEAVLTNPGSLSEAEWVLMRHHVVQTRDILSKMYFIGEFKRIPLIAGQHHERINGKGYPENLTGEQIEFEAKILAVCDVYDALTVKRYYRNPMSSEEALKYMTGLVEIEFDKDCMAALIGVVGRYGPPQNPEQEMAEQFGPVQVNPDK